MSDTLSVLLTAEHLMMEMGLITGCVGTVFTDTGCVSPLGKVTKWQQW